MFAFSQRTYFTLSAAIALVFLAQGGTKAGDVRVEAVEQSAQSRSMFPTAALSIVSQSGQTSAFQVELATTPAQHRRGLMFRESLDADRGMLFDYNPPRCITMWMKNTLISLDMLFFDADAKLVYIAANTKPLSQDLIEVPVLVRYVLEVPAGTAQRLGLRPGDRIVLP